MCVSPLSLSLFLYVSLPHGLYFTDSLHNERLPLTRGSRIHWRRHFWIAVKSDAIFGSSRKSGRFRQRLSFIYQSQEESVHSGRKSSRVRGFSRNDRANFRWNLHSSLFHCLMQTAHACCQLPLQ